MYICIIWQRWLRRPLQSRWRRPLQHSALFQAARGMTGSRMLTVDMEKERHLCHQRQHRPVAALHLRQPLHQQPRQTVVIFLNKYDITYRSYWTTKATHLIYTEMYVYLYSIFIYPIYNGLYSFCQEISRGVHRVIVSKHCTDFLISSLATAVVLPFSSQNITHFLTHLVCLCATVCWWRHADPFQLSFLYWCCKYLSHCTLLEPSRTSITQMHNQ